MVSYYDMETYNPGKVKIKIQGDDPDGSNMELIDKSQYQILEVSYDKDSLTLRIDGDEKGIKAVGDLNLNGEVTLLDRNIFELPIRISDFLIFDQKLSDDMRQDVFNRLNDKLAAESPM